MFRKLSVVVLVVLAGCASLPLKQKAVETLQASETALEAAHSAERSLCSPTADQTKAITHCDGSGATSIGLTDVRHHDLAVAFSHAFDLQGKAALALKSWSPGTTAPSTVSDYVSAVQQVLALIQEIFPATDTVTVNTQTAAAKGSAAAVLAGAQ